VGGGGAGRSSVSLKMSPFCAGECWAVYRVFGCGEKGCGRAGPWLLDGRGDVPSLFSWI
jgi:hypothetical protein